MIKQPGGLLEHMLRSKDNSGECISYAELDNEQSVHAYLKSAYHQEIKRHNTNITVQTWW